jgi:hypothetical protein
MKQVAALALAALCAMSASALDTRYVKIKSTNDVAALLAAFPEWNRPTATNGVTVSVCVGMVDTPPLRVALLFQDLSFDKDGRLSHVSPVRPSGAAFRADSFIQNNSFDDVIKTLSTLSDTQRILAQPIRSRRFSRRPADER